MNLYEIDQAMKVLIDPETGELLDESAYISLAMNREKKIENTALYIKNLTAEANAIKDELDALQERKKSAENKAKRLREYLLHALDGEKFSTARCAVSYRTSKALEVDDVSVAADWLENNGYKYLVTYGAPSLDKRAVTDLIKQGQEVPGVELVARKSIQVR